MRNSRFLGLNFNLSIRINLKFKTSHRIHFELYYMIYMIFYKILLNNIKIFGLALRRYYYWYLYFGILLKCCLIPNNSINDCVLKRKSIYILFVSCIIGFAHVLLILFTPYTNHYSWYSIFKFIIIFRRFIST